MKLLRNIVNIFALQIVAYYLSCFFGSSTLSMQQQKKDPKIQKRKPCYLSTYYLGILRACYLSNTRLVTPHATNRDMLFYRKSSLWGCYYSRHVTNRDVLLLATIRYLKKEILASF